MDWETWPMRCRETWLSSSLTNVPPKTRDMLHTSYRAFRYSPNFHDDMYFGDSRYSMGIQLADLCAYFIGRHLEGDTETKPFYDMVSPHITFSLQQPKQPGDGAEVVKDAK